ncbi:hypothetical protein JTB14_036709 [Gonioctena quinquepunctata]|nr:hypothetical protein JTB14_036709 [Gonioctena quinquepunctata]
MKIAHLNIRSLFTGFQEFKEIVLENDIDIMLSETWLGPDDHSVVVDIPGYTLFRKDRVGRGGGVGAYVKVSEMDTSNDTASNTSNHKIDQILRHLKLDIVFSKYLKDLLMQATITISLLSMFSEEDFRNLEDFAKMDPNNLFDDNEKKSFFGIPKTSQYSKLWKVTENSQVE